jgi:hypothetical protein
MPTSWSAVFQAVQSQGKSPSPDKPQSPSAVYLAYLDKADWDASESSWYLMFDMIPAEAALLGLAGNTGDDMPPPPLPTIIFHATGSTQDAVSTAFQLSEGEEPAEGSWYALYLEPDGDPKTLVVGDLYHPNTDFAPNSPSYGQWHIAAATLIVLPGPPKSKTLFSRPRGPRRFTLAAKTLPRTYPAVTKLFGVRKAHRYKPRRKYLRLRLRVVVVPPLPPPPPPGYGALGVMAIGQGGFNLVFDRGTLEPAFYFDTGYPLGFFHGSLPATMNVNNVAFQGPIFQNAAANLSVILSHWDWDHWRFGAYVHPGNGNTLGARPWVVPVQPMSPTAAIFLATVANVQNVPIGAAPQALGANGLTLYKLQPPLPAPAAFIVNNSGLAVGFPVDLAAMQSAPVMLTGDGNFNLLPGAALGALQVIGAVHHGSNNHGAAANLPVPPGAIVGRIAYSYGVNPATGNHAYGFPNVNAVNAYHASNWNAPNQEGTAEGANINAGPAVAGNIRVGDQNALPGAYAGTAFAANPYQIL